MSLLIKALDKAQAEKAQVKDGAAKQKAVKSKSEKPSKPKSKKSAEALSLEEVDNSTSKQSNTSQGDEVPQALKGSAAEASQQAEQAQKPEQVREPKVDKGTPAAQAQAANVFAAKHNEPAKHSAKLAILIGLIALALMGALAYWYQTEVNVPDIVIPPRPTRSQEMPEPLPELALADEEPIKSEPEMVDPEVVTALTKPGMVAEPAAGSAIDQQPSEVFTQQEPESVSQTENTFPTAPPELKPSTSELSPSVEETLAINETVVAQNAINLSTDEMLGDVGIASESASIKVTPQKTTSGVNPILMRAYEAYNAGNDRQAQQDYKQVLKRYGLNVDAMLGLGAIASRQGRVADANSWYRKVLELEPRNEVAKAGLLSLQQESQPQNNESNIKSMLATAPNDANLHAALGDLYASQNQWPLAQQAYFDAYRFKSSAENAFNLGISLDQLGKPKLALPYYQEALQKSGQSEAIDVEALRARISSIK